MGFALGKADQGTTLHVVSGTHSILKIALTRDAPLVFATKSAAPMSRNAQGLPDRRLYPIQLRIAEPSRVLPTIRSWDSTTACAIARSHPTTQTAMIA
ncbi:hypothetical protein LX81_03775 [Palleronia aestuarii]|uniref:Uncharacterized protein n=2 Tax=Palleronia aestuarii TaxID=568105 RepID=A0A2W7PR67_9RHOB|nr:hypothetical protein LX81_03775 [Palleronia aestuarii]